MFAPTPVEAPPQPSAALFQMITGAWVAQMLAVVAKLGVADLLADGPRRAPEIAEACGAHAPSLRRVLRALAATGVFAETADGRFELTAVGAALRSDAPDSLRAVAAMCGQPWHLEAWSHLCHSVKTGEPAFERAHGRGLFAFLDEDEDAGAWFHAAMTNLSAADAAVIGEAYDFSRFGTIVDVGGGHGALMAAILRSAPAARGVVFDLRGVVAGAHEALSRAGVADRCELAAGDFFESVPAGADAYVLRHVLHDWHDEQATALLRGVRRAMAERATVLVLEHLLGDGGAPSPGTLLDVEMLVVAPRGRERTEAEFRDLLAGAGLRLERVVPMRSAVSILEARRA